MGCIPRLFSSSMSLSFSEPALDRRAPGFRLPNTVRAKPSCRHGAYRFCLTLSGDACFPLLIVLRPGLNLYRSFSAGLYHLYFFVFCSRFKLLRCLTQFYLARTPAHQRMLTIMCWVTVKKWTKVKKYNTWWCFVRALLKPNITKPEQCQNFMLLQRYTYRIPWIFQFGECGTHGFSFRLASATFSKPDTFYSSMVVDKQQIFQTRTTLPVVSPKTCWDLGRRGCMFVCAGWASLRRIPRRVEETPIDTCMFEIPDLTAIVETSSPFRNLDVEKY